MIICFKLTMPNNNSWNGKWTGEGNLYARTFRFTTKAMKEKAQKALEGGSYYYNFGDGWGASVAVSEISADERKRINKASKGFCGYDWMIDSIFKHGKITV